MKKKLLFLLGLLLLLPIYALGQTTLTGTIKNPDGSGFNGSLTFTLQQQSAISSGTGCTGTALVPPNRSVAVTVVNGALQSPPTLYSSYCTIPLGVPYIVTAMDTNGNILFTDQWLIVGTTFDVGTAQSTVNDTLIGYAGIWANGTTYNIGQLVSYNSQSYASLINTNIGHVPSASPNDWQLVQQTPTVTAGTATSLPYGSTPTVTNVGTPSAAVFNFGIPQGSPGGAGNPGGSSGQIQFNNTGSFGGLNLGGTLSVVGGALQDSAVPVSGGNFTGSIGGTNATFSGMLQAGQVNAMFNAFEQQTGGGNNGIANSLTACGSLSYQCLILSPPNYATTENAPFGGFFQFISNGESVGPKSTDPIGGYLDERWGVPQWIFNSSKNIDTRHTASPSLYMNFVGQSSLTGTFVDLAPVLQMQSSYFAGGRTFGVSDNMNAPGATLQYNAWTVIQGGGAWGVAANCYGGGDCLREGGDIVGYGAPTPEVGEGIEGANHEVTMGTHVFNADVSGTPSVGTDGTTSFATASQVNNGTQGEDRIMTDMTSVYNTGYINAIIQNDSSDLSATCAGGCNWDSTFGLSTKTTLSTAITNPINGTNSFPQSSVNMTVASSTGFTVGHVACVYDYNYECEEISAVPDGTHITLATVRMPHVVGAYVTTGGLAGYVIRFEADDCTSANGCRGMQLAGHYSALFGNTLYYELPVMYSSTGDKLWIFQGGNSAPGVGGVYDGAAYLQMAGSGGTCSVTVNAGAVTAVTVTGGTGYLGNDPPQLVLSGITYTTAPVLYVNGMVGGALSSAAIYNAGSGLSGTPTCTVVTSNPYDLYDAAKVVQVWNPATGAVDGSKIVTEPWPVTPANGDAIQEQPYYYEHTSADVIGGVGQYFPSLGDEGISAYGGNLYGVYQGNDVALSWFSNTTPNLFNGSPGPQILGYGQYLTPIFSDIKMPSRIYRNYFYPPFGPGGNGGSLISGYEPAVDSITCGTQWKNPWWMQTFNGTQQNGWMANCSTDTIYGVVKNLDLSGVTNLNLGNPTIATSGGLASGLSQNWNANSNTFTAASWNSGTCGGGSATITADPTVTDPYGGHNAYKVVTINHSAGSCVDVDTGTPLTNGGTYSGHLWVLDPSGQVCFGIGNNGSCGPVGAATWQKISVSSITPNPALLTNTFDFYDDLGNNTYWVYNAVAVNLPIDSGELVTGNTQQTTNTSVNQILGSPICTAANGQCGSSGSIVASAEVVAFSATPTFSILYNVSRIVLTGNITSFTLGAGADGQDKKLCFKQGSSSTYTVTPPSNVHGFFSSSGWTTLSDWNCQSYTYDNTDSIWLADSPGVINQ